MSRLVWNERGSRKFHSGVDRGVFYPAQGRGIAWNGLISVRETPSSASERVLYFDGQKYNNDVSEDTFAGTIEALTYPDQLMDFDGYRHPFNFSYRTQVRNDLDEEHHEIHLVYNVWASPTARAYSTLPDLPEPLVFSWDFTTTPVLIPNMRPSAHVYISSLFVRPTAMQAVEDLIYGSEGQNADLPAFETLLDFFESLSILRIIDHGDGTWTAQGPDDVIRMLDPTTFEISWPTAVYLDEHTYEISSS